jgi:hypothetical protein
MPVGNGRDADRSGADQDWRRPQGNEDRPRLEAVSVISSLLMQVHDPFN